MKDRLLAYAIMIAAGFALFLLPKDPPRHCIGPVEQLFMNCIR